MTFTSNQEAIQQEPTPEFYEINSAGNVDKWTSFNRSLTFLGETWKPAPIKRSGISTDVQFGSVQVTINAPLTGNFIKYIANQPIEPVQVTIYSAIKSDLTDYVIRFKGKLINVGIKNGEVRALCEARSSIFTKKIPNVIYQSYCNNDVFRGKCYLTEFAWRETGTVTAISGSDYTISGFDSFSDGYFSGGTIEFTNDWRLILDHVGEVVTLHIPFDSRVYVGSEVVGLPGCDGSPLMCRDRFSNLINFVGMPYIPSHNPVVWGFK